MYTPKKKVKNWNWKNPTVVVETLHVFNPETILVILNWRILGDLREDVQSLN